MPGVQARMAMLSELVGGTFIVLGFITRPVCLILIVTMLVAVIFGHKGGGYLITNDPPGNEYAINLAMILFVMVLLGPGIYSLDARIFGF